MFDRGELVERWNGYQWQNVRYCHPATGRYQGFHVIRLCERSPYSMKFQLVTDDQLRKTTLAGKLRPAI